MEKSFSIKCLKIGEQLGDFIMENDVQYTYFPFIFNAQNALFLHYAWSRTYYDQHYISTESKIAINLKCII